MSDIKLLNLKNKKILTKQKLDKLSIKKIIEDYSKELLGVSVIASNLNLTDNEYEQIDTLGYDENYQLTIIEYRIGKFSSTINKGIVFLDFIKNNQGKIKTLLNEKMGYEETKNIIINPRLISIGDDYNQYDDYAIKQIPYSIELIKYQLYDKNIILLEKNYQSRKLDKGYNNIEFNDQNQYNIYKLLSEFILSLGDEVCEVNNYNYISYRKIKNFIYIMLNDGGLELKLEFNNKFKTIHLQNLKDFEKYQNVIEQCYDEN